jgi:hypothetical protein
MSRTVTYVILSALTAASFGFDALAQDVDGDVEQGYGFSYSLYEMVYSFGPMVLFLVVFILLYQRGTRDTRRHYAETLPRYAEEQSRYAEQQSQHMEQLIQRLDKLIQVLEKK